MAFVALLDSCVLYPAPLRDFLLQLATTGCFRARWSDSIHDEWMRNVLKNRSDLTAGQLHRTRALMDRAVPDCIITGYERTMDTLDLPDAGDRHVLAAVIVGRVDVIVTYNLADFPKDALNPFGILARHPDDFLQQLTHLAPQHILFSAKACRARLKNPVLSPEEYLAVMTRQRLPALVSFLRQNDGLF